MSPNSVSLSIPFLLLYISVFLSLSFSLPVVLLPPFLLAPLNACKMCDRKSELQSIVISIV